MKSWRQSQILDVIDQEAVASQEELRQQLEERGIDATQATISRDLKELGLVKRAGDGAYVRPGADAGSRRSGEQLRRAVAALVRGFERVDTADGGPDGSAVRRRAWRSGSTARSSPRWPARLPATTRFCSCAAASTRRRRHRSAIEEMVKALTTSRCAERDRPGVLGRLDDVGGDSVAGRAVRRRGRRR